MLSIYIFLGIWMIALFVFVCFLLHSVVCYVGCKSLSLIVSDLARAFLSTVFWLTEVLGLTRCVLVWMDNQTPLAKGALAAAAATTTTTTTTTATAVKTVETQVPSMRCVLWELGSLPSALWWLCGAWYLQTRPIIAAAAFQEELILVAGKIKRPLWPLSWWGLGWSCCCSPCVWEWGTNRGSSWGSRKPKTTEELQRGSRRKERRESSHIFLAKQQLDLRNKNKKTPRWLLIVVVMCVSGKLIWPCKLPVLCVWVKLAGGFVLFVLNVILSAQIFSWKIAPHFFYIIRVTVRQHYFTWLLEHYENQWLGR